MYDEAFDSGTEELDLDGYSFDTTNTDYGGEPTSDLVSQRSERLALVASTDLPYHVQTQPIDVHTKYILSTRELQTKRLRMHLTSSMQPMAYEGVPYEASTYAIPHLRS